jgi:hypothetical protein
VTIEWVVVNLFNYIGREISSEREDKSRPFLLIIINPKIRQQNTLVKIIGGQSLLLELERVAV